MRSFTKLTRPFATCKKCIFRYILVLYALLFYTVRLHILQLILKMIQNISEVEAL